ncbi:hypothetical protein GQ457_07G009370 [Hibiscus cannabinus]
MDFNSIGLNAKDFCLVPDLVISPDFEIPSFEKYDGTSCLKLHLTMFSRKMEGYLEDESLLIHCFHDSWSGNYSSVGIETFARPSQKVEKKFMKGNLECLINLYYEALDALKSRNKVENQEELRVHVFLHYTEMVNSSKPISILGKWYDYAQPYRKEVSKKSEFKAFDSTMAFPKRVSVHPDKKMIEDSIDWVEDNCSHEKKNICKCPIDETNIKGRNAKKRNIGIRELHFRE